MGITKNKPLDVRPYFFDDKPLFGLDVGHDELRVIQFDIRQPRPLLKGYGTIGFPPESMIDDVIVKPELVAKAAQQLFSKQLIGDISTKRVAVSLPASRALTRAVQLPKMNPKDIDEAVKTEIEQYLPIQSANMYVDYTRLRESDDSIEVFVVAMPQKIVDSYLDLTRLMGLEAVLFDTAIGASAHLFALDPLSKVPTVLVDFGSTTTDITIFNHGLVVTGTVAFGGDDVTVAIARTLRVTPNEAIMLKSRYGLGESVFQKQIMTAVETPLASLIKEIRRTIRYYEQRYTKEEPIAGIVTMGGGANMPGLNEYLTQQLNLHTQTFDPIARIDVGHLQSFYRADRMTYVTAAGLAITKPAEIFA